jgi:hypothetical protein
LLSIRQKGPEKVPKLFLISFLWDVAKMFSLRPDFSDDLAELFYQELATLFLSCWAAFVRIGFVFYISDSEIGFSFSSISDSEISEYVIFLYIYSEAIIFI